MPTETFPWSTSGSLQTGLDFRDDGSWKPEPYKRKVNPAYPVDVFGARDSDWAKGWMKKEGKAGCDCGSGQKCKCEKSGGSCECGGKDRKAAKSPGRLRSLPPADTEFSWRGGDLWPIGSRTPWPFVPMRPPKEPCWKVGGRHTDCTDGKGPWDWEPPVGPIWWKMPRDIEESDGYWFFEHDDEWRRRCGAPCRDICAREWWKWCQRQYPGAFVGEFGLNPEDKYKKRHIESDPPTRELLDDFMSCCSHPLRYKSERNWQGRAKLNINRGELKKLLDNIARMRWIKNHTFSCTREDVSLELRGGFTVVIPSIAGVLGKRSVLVAFARRLLKEQAEEYAKDFKCTGKCTEWGQSSLASCVRTVVPPDLKDCIVTGSQGGRYKQKEFSMEGKKVGRTVLIGGKSGVVASTTLIICLGARSFHVGCLCPKRVSIGPAPF